MIINTIGGISHNISFEPGENKGGFHITFLSNQVKTNNCKRSSYLRPSNGYRCKVQAISQIYLVYVHVRVRLSNKKCNSLKCFTYDSYASEVLLHTFGKSAGYLMMIQRKQNTNENNKTLLMSQKTF
jgi:hypothetical protein